jgi:hypothetical protein
MTMNGGAKSAPPGKRIGGIFHDGRTFTGSWLTRARGNYFRSPSCLAINYFLPQLLPAVPNSWREVIPL